MTAPVDKPLMLIIALACLAIAALFYGANYTPVAAGQKESNYVQEIYLKDGTHCVYVTYHITCDWRGDK